MGGVAGEIKKLTELHEQGILTDEEFNEQKKKLLSTESVVEIKTGSQVEEMRGTQSFWLGVLVGFIAMIVLCLIPILGPILAGLVAGTIAGGVGRGAGAGFLSGIIGPLVAFGLFELNGGFMLSGGWLGGLIIQLIMVLLTYAVLGLIGGAVGGIIRKKSVK